MFDAASRLARLLVAPLMLIAGGTASGAWAQSAPLSLPPPGYLDGATANEPGKTKRPPRKVKRDGAESTAQAPSKRRDEPQFSDTAPTRDARPRRFVPEEFDNGTDDGGSSPRPIMSPSGRPGVGMRF